MPTDRSCSVEGCEKTNIAKGLCTMHYQRMRNWGSTDPRPIPEKQACSVEGCDRHAVVRGVCGMHNHRILTYGSPDDPRTPPLVRLMGQTKTDGTCLVYTGNIIPPTGKRKNGYGLFWLNGKNVLAHRASYELFVGPVPDGLEIDHLCNRPACVNPTHLEAVTAAENSRRARQRRGPASH